MSRSPIPEDVRARIASLFPRGRPTPADLRARAAAPRPDRVARTTAEVLARVNAQDPALFRYALGLLAEPARPTDRATAEQEIALTMAAVRILAYRREIAALGHRLADAPTDAAARRRVADLSGQVREIERRFPGAGQRARAERRREATS